MYSADAMRIAPDYGGARRPSTLSIISTASGRFARTLAAAGVISHPLCAIAMQATSDLQRAGRLRRTVRATTTRYIPDQLPNPRGFRPRRRSQAGDVAPPRRYAESLISDLRATPLDRDKRWLVESRILIDTPIGALIGVIGAYFMPCAESLMPLVRRRCVWLGPVRNPRH